MKNESDGTGGTPPGGAEVPNNATAPEHVLYMNPEVFRARLQRISPQRQPARWAEENLKLGANLQQLARRERGAARARICSEAIEAFEAALGVYCRCKTPDEYAGRRRTLAAVDSRMPPRTEGAIDGVIAFARRPMVSGAQDLEQSIELFQEASSRVVRDSEFETWVLNTINLACALVLAGKCDSTNGNSARLEEAIEVCNAVLDEPRLARMPYERAAACINLAEALTSLAEVSFPDERVDYLDRALRSLAAALVAVGPPNLTSILETESGACA